MIKNTDTSANDRQEQKCSLLEIERLDKELQRHFQSKYVVHSSLTRTVVSFQANKARPVYRWYKYKEAFSVSLVEYLFRHYGVEKGMILDPFAGSGTALFAASDLGIDAEGIELLPIGQQIIATKKLLDTGLTSEELYILDKWSCSPIWELTDEMIPIPELRITKGAYPEATKRSIEKYLGACQKETGRIRDILLFALLCILESVSYTRKDGQYLRWDHRSGRKQGNRLFDKGVVPDFNQAISDKLRDIIGDIVPTERQERFFVDENNQGSIFLYNGSCLDILPKLDSNKYDAVITSPPYCNRYDYTRTYALELALLGIDEKSLIELRQTMISCTVENKTKDLINMNPAWTQAVKVAEQEELLQSILGYLDDQRARGLLNNNSIPRMVKGYFYETACIIAECSRVLKPGAPLFMVNDNVRYAGASVSVDMILSHFAEQLGFSVEKILVLPQGKGNSSQQMGAHGRDPLRKCVYLWRKL